MKTGIRFFIVAISLLTLSGCRRSADRLSYAKFVRDEKNGLSRTLSIDGWQYIVQYRPAELIMLQEGMSGQDSRRKDGLRGVASFTIKIKRADNSASPLRYNLATREEYDQRLDYFLNAAAKNIRLLYGNDTLYPAAYHFETNYNLTPEETMLVGFLLPAKDEAPKRDMQLSYNDELFKNGIIKVTIKKEDVDNIPNLVE